MLAHEAAEHIAEQVVEENQDVVVDLTEEEVIEVVTDLEDQVFDSLINEIENDSDVTDTLVQDVLTMEAVFGFSKDASESVTMSKWEQIQMDALEHPTLTVLYRTQVE